MSYYSINPQININQENIKIIMSELIKNISESIKTIFNIIIKLEYIKMLDIINNILNNYLKIYKFYDYGITNIDIQIYNQNINSVMFIYVKLGDLNYYSIYSDWYNFYNGIYNEQPKIVYQALTQQQKNELINSIVSDKLYFIDEIIFSYKNVPAIGILLKLQDMMCDCITKTNNALNNKNINKYVYINTIYWY